MFTGEESAFNTSTTLGNNNNKKKKKRTIMNQIRLISRNQPAWFISERAGEHGLRLSWLCCIAATPRNQAADSSIHDSDFMLTHDGSLDGFFFLSRVVADC